ncbi:MAG TPA: hypothetical protein VMW54_13425 [Terriglobia bacterium]|nr:hypothetical protein [Terriglobia bacterium]
MKKSRGLVVFSMSAVMLALMAPSLASARRKKPATVSPDDPTYQLYQLLDKTRGGKLNDFYLLADIYSDPQDPGRQLRHVLCVNYNKSSFFGRLQIDVRSVGKMTPAQLKTYTPKQIYDFGMQDQAKFEKINPGPFGESGDLFLRATSTGSLAPASVTDEVSAQYDSFLTQYILPALKK